MKGPRKPGIDAIADVAHIEIRRVLSQLDGVRIKVRREVPANITNDVDHAFSQLVRDLDSTRDVKPETPIFSAKRLYESSDLLRPSDFRSNAAKPERKAHSHFTSLEYGRIVHSMAFRRLQGKMQLFPPTESPLLRNRLTHTLEVADIAASIATLLNLNYEASGFKLDVSIVATAALIHDLGHPPFGHSGEIALNSFMQGWGGFEGNAQSLRIVTRLENRIVKEFPRSRPFDKIYEDPLGLNLMMRTIAAVVKYDNAIPSDYNNGEVCKGYYEEDRQIVELVKTQVLSEDGGRSLPLRTIECQIMDIADDIAYSTYDLEDCLIAGLTTPIDIMSCDAVVTEQIARTVSFRLKKHGYTHELTSEDISIVLIRIFDSLIKFNKDSKYDTKRVSDLSSYVIYTHQESRMFSNNPLLRRWLTEVLINGAIESIFISEFNQDIPAISKIDILTDSRLYIEALKAFNYHRVISSSRLQIYHTRAQEIVTKVCQTLFADKHDRMLPEQIKYDLGNYISHSDKDFDLRSKKLVKKTKSETSDRREERLRRRFICDYVSSLTDAETIALYANMTSADQRTIFGMRA